MTQKSYFGDEKVVFRDENLKNIHSSHNFGGESDEILREKSVNLQSKDESLEVIGERREKIKHNQLQKNCLYPLFPTLYSTNFATCFYYENR